MLLGENRNVYFRIENWTLHTLHRYVIIMMPIGQTLPRSLETHHS